MARRYLQGVKGSIRKFILPVSESVFGGDRVVFRDTGSVGLSYRMNFVDAGKAVIDDDVINLRSGTHFYNEGIRKLTIH